MRKAWNKGLTKHTSISVRKISDTMKTKGIDNFAKWRKNNHKKPKPGLKKNGNLAELLGVILGDGNICKLPRTEGLRIVGNSNNPGFANRYAYIIKKVFNKEPTLAHRNCSNAINITLYQKGISSRLGIPTGNKRYLEFILPTWIKRNDKFIQRFLRGLYESDGCHSTHLPTHTYKFIFRNYNDSLLNIVFDLLRSLGFHPHRSKYAIQISRKKEVQNVVDLLQFRNY